ncbi:HpcH/HpaI aldolase/citrate lyase family protein [Mesorhizobium sp. B2-2-4]|uniref:HpcH/HpaI aldolase family protein n=1 Tax=unclassified Mesorhizobium TaxID=325217 RepID=UPI0011284C9E|nr:MULTISPECIES: HpcH/HpaI aldolase/citrate lyase family protein [unclassified Mesorhizobium]TPM54342.1 HpcH/HpaI aldolase/citrate lyase family protein [Mesorhizobium sp. B2-2-4]TPM64436.1 HpcH/HpaI aldolase/citrate lyase family protein [Mesorhizobium sp. B2-2-1]TPN69476.1 HpcH/HpaI aldolase/citrate lyase family protein [Mesorhizobium sp. B1-1-3]
MSLKSRLAADETLVTAWSGVPDALTVEILARQGFDAVTLDMQHGGHHEDSVLRGLAPVLATGKPALVRIPVGRFDMASRALDFGAEAVIAPMVNSVADAKLFAAAMKYPPVGERSWGPTYAFPRHGKGDHTEWLRDSDQRTMAFAMVETRAALDALDGILDTPGIDGIFLGPSDFSIAWSNGATVDSTLESMMETVGSIAERTRKAGKHAAIYVIEPAIAGRVVAMGYRLLATGSEHALISLGAKTLLKGIKDSIGG